MASRIELPSDSTVLKAAECAISPAPVDSEAAVSVGESPLGVGPSRMSSLADVLVGRFLKFDAADPRWPDRDRLIMPSPSIFVSSDAVLETARGEALAVAVGMALAERLLAARFGRSLVDHRTWVMTSSRDLIEGLTQEAMDLAGRLCLDRLMVLLETAPDSGDGEPINAADRGRRFASAGWAVRELSTVGETEIADAIAFSIRSRKPTLIEVRTPAGRTTDVTSSTAYDVEDEPSRSGLSLATPARGASTRRSWLKRVARHPLRFEYERVMACRLPDTWSETFSRLRSESGANEAPRSAWDIVQDCLAASATTTPELVAGTAGLSVPIAAQSPAVVSRHNFAGRHIGFGMRPHGMTACLNGVAAHGGVLPIGQMPLVLADHSLASMRSAAAANLRVVYLLADDGNDRTPYGQSCDLAGLRAIPGLFVLTPAHAAEALECWELALRRGAGPSALVLGTATAAKLREAAGENRSGRGGYVLAAADATSRHATLIATGADVAVAMKARDILWEDGIAVTVVSLVSWDLFASQPVSYREQVLGSAPRFGLERGRGFGWERWLGLDGAFLSTTEMAEGAPAATANAVRARVRRNS